MKNKLGLILLVVLVRPLAAAQLWDEAYSYKRITSAVVNTDVEPVYGEQVERAMADYLRRNARFEFSNAGYLKLKERLKAGPAPNLGKPGEERVLDLLPALTELATMKVRAVVLADVRHSSSSDDYLIFMVLATTGPVQATLSKEVTVTDPKVLDNFSAAAEQGIAELMHSIPYDASILSRVGDTVVLDRGDTVFQLGRHVSVFTIESSDVPLRFERLGSIVITHVDRDMAFGKVEKERRPGEISVGNKLRFDTPPEPEYHSGPPPMLLSQNSGGGSGESRSLASMEPEIFARANLGQPQGRIGFIDIGLGGTLLSIENRSSASQPGLQGNLAYPMLRLGTEIWLTSRFFVDLGADFSLSQIGGNDGGGPGWTTSSLHDFRGQLGYRIHFFAPDPGPYLHFKLGYASQTYATSADASQGFASLTYSGLWLGAGMGIPVGPHFGLGFDVNTFLFPGVSASPAPPGDSQGVYGWDFTLGAYYRVSTNLRAEGKVLLLGTGTEFTAGPIQYAHQSGRGLVADLSYYF